MRVVEAAGRTVDEAVRDALRQLGVGRDQVEIEILEEGSKGLFGLLGSRRARVRVELKPGVEVPVFEGPSFVEDGFDDVEEADETPVTPPAPRHKVGQGRRDDEGDGPAADGTRRPLSRDELQIIEEKLDIARQFVAGVLERLEVDAALELRLDDDGLGHIHIVGEELGLVIGRRGQTLDALQFLANQVANKQRGVWARIVIDAGGYRERRAEALEALAGRMADRALRQGRKVSLEPMNAFERRIVHLSLADDDGVETYSEGEDPHRRVVIVPRRSPGHQR